MENNQAKPCGCVQMDCDQPCHCDECQCNEEVNDETILREYPILRKILNHEKQD